MGIFQATAVLFWEETLFGVLFFTRRVYDPLTSNAGIYRPGPIFSPLLSSKK